MTRLLFALTLLALPLPAHAQTANASPTSGTGAGGDNILRTAPSGGTASPNPGQSQVGAPTPLDEHEEHQSQKDTTSVCKGC